MSINLWRYMDIEKFERLLKGKSLYFCSAKNFEDAFEAEYAWGVNGHKKFLEKMRELNKKQNSTMRDEDFILNQLKGIKDLSSRSYVSCWNKDIHESEAMWKLYCKDNGKRGIVIKTDNNKLQDCLRNSDKKVKFQPVKYKPIFYVENYQIDMEKMITYKRKAFQFENEYRAFFMDGLDVYPTNGYNIPIDLKDLIIEIRISPYADKAFKDEILELISSLGLSIPVKKSEIELNPILQLKDEIIEQGRLPYGATFIKNRLSIDHPDIKAEGELTTTFF